MTEKFRDTLTCLTCLLGTFSENPKFLPCHVSFVSAFPPPPGIADLKFRKGGGAKFRPWKKSKHVCILVPCQSIIEGHLCHMFYDIVEIKPKCRGLEIKFLTMLGQSTGNHLYFTMISFFCSEKLPKSVEKVILLKKSA